MLGDKLVISPHNQTCWHPRDPERWNKDWDGTGITSSPQAQHPLPPAQVQNCPRTSDAVPVDRPEDAGLGAARGGTHQLQPLAPAQGDVSGQAGEGGQGVDGEGELADRPPSRIHRSAGIAPGIPFLQGERGG